MLPEHNWHLFYLANTFEIFKEKQKAETIDSTVVFSKQLNVSILRLMLSTVYIILSIFK